MMNFFNNMNLIPKNFIVAGIVDTLKSDPEAGAQKVFEMADKFVSDDAMAGLLEEVKNAYYSKVSIRMYVKNLIYNTQKSALNHFLNNVVVKHLIDGIPYRQSQSEKLGLEIPHTLILNIGSGKKLMGDKDIARLVGEAKNLGLHCLLVSGAGLSHPGLWELCEAHLDIQFLVFCQPKDLGAAACKRLENLPNVVPLVMVSPESGVDLSALKGAGLLFGVMMDTTRDNFQQATSDGAVLPFIRQGSRLTIYATKAADQLTKTEIQRIKHRVDNIRQVRPYVTVHVEKNNTGLVVEETINGQLFTYTVPEFGPEIAKKSLKDVFKRS